MENKMEQEKSEKPRRRVNIFGKSIPVLAIIAAIGMATTVSAVLIFWFGTQISRCFGRIDSGIVRLNDSTTRSLPA